MKKLVILCSLTLIFSLASTAFATEKKTSWSLMSTDTIDTDGDGLSDQRETIYGTDPTKIDTDGDGFQDEQEIQRGYDPKVFMDREKLPQHIYVSIAKQEMRYYSGPYLIGDIQISTGVPGKDTPVGEYSVLKKYPLVTFKGPDYYYPNTKWALLFKPSKGGSYYIHGAFWHSNFGKKMSHGCVNVAYADMEKVYNWANVGTPVTILSGDFK